MNRIDQTKLLRSFLILVIGVSWPATLDAGSLRAELLSVQKIWDRAPHNGFTDLIRFRDEFFCCFREGLDHVGGDGVIRILSSADGSQWINRAGIREDGIDLREPSLAITPDGKRLYMICGGSIFNELKVLQSRQTRFATSTDGIHWTAPQKLLVPGEWLWRVEANPADRQFHGIADNIFPTTGGPKPEDHWSLTTYSSANGVDWLRGVTLDAPGKPNQATLRFLRDGRAMALVRRDSDDRSGMIGVTTSPYRDWRWAKVSRRIAGPNFIELPSGDLIAGSRGFGKKSADNHVVLHAMIDTTLEPIMRFPSGGSDCGYVGLVWHNNSLWATYNSSHEGKTCVYLARVRLTGLNPSNAGSK